MSREETFQETIRKSWIQISPEEYAFNHNFGVIDWHLTIIDLTIIDLLNEKVIEFSQTGGLSESVIRQNYITQDKKALLHQKERD